MTFSVSVRGRCAGGNHVHLTLTVDGVAREITFELEEMKRGIAELGLEVRVLSRIRSAILESGADTFAQIKAAIEGKEFKV